MIISGMVIYLLGYERLRHKRKRWKLANGRNRPTGSTSPNFALMAKPDIFDLAPKTKFHVSRLGLTRALACA
jgi:hypothetical protein